MANKMDYNNNSNTRDLDAFLAENSGFFNNYDNTPLMTDTDTESFNPADLSLSTNFGNLNGFSAPQEVVPAAPQLQIPQPQMPAGLAGPFYHPTVGWFYPAAGPANVPPPPMLPFGGMTPATSVPTTGTSTPIPAGTNAAPAPPHNNGQGKRKYGPGAYLDARAEGRTTIGNDEANYFASSASRRDGRGDNATGSNSLDNAFRRKGTRPSIVQACICEDSKPDHIKRPRNAFILFRVAKADDIRKQLGTKYNPAVSARAGELWKAASPEVKEYYKRMADKEKQQHELKYPGYKYKPGGTTRTKFGTPGCTCGAYEMNMARHREKRSAAGVGVGNVTFDDNTPADSEMDDAYIPSRIRPQAPAPTAMMMPPPDLDIASLGLPAHQQAQAEAVLAGLKRKHDLTISTGCNNSAEEPARKRRSPRVGTGNVNYAEPTEDEIPFDFNADDLFDFGAPYKTPSTGEADRFQPSPKSRGNLNGRGGSKTAEQQSPIFVASSPPAKNTRSRSQSRDASPPSPETPIKIEDSEDEDENDEIVVGKKSTLKKNSSAGKSTASSRSTRSQTQRRRSLRSGGGK